MYDSTTNHFSDALWADFVRNVGSEECRREMQAHLDSGCKPCRAIADCLRAVATMAVNERMLMVPQEFVDRAKEIAEGSSASGWIENLTASVAHLMESISFNWQPAGVRSLGDEPGPAGRPMLFRADDYAVYLKVEPLLGGEVAEVVGGIVNEREHEENMEGIPVQMVAKGRTLSQTATNRFGEFLIEYPIRKHATLRFALRHRGQRIDLPLGPALENDTFGDRK